MAESVARVADIAAAVRSAMAGFVRQVFEELHGFEERLQELVERVYQCEKQLHTLWLRMEVQRHGKA